MSLSRPIQCTHCGSISIAGVLLPPGGEVSEKHLRKIEQAEDQGAGVTAEVCPLCHTPLKIESDSIDADSLMRKLAQLNLNGSEKAALTKLIREILNGETALQEGDTEDKSTTRGVLRALLPSGQGNVYSFLALLVSTITLAENYTADFTSLGQQPVDTRERPTESTDRSPQSPTQRQLEQLPYIIFNPPVSGSAAGEPSSSIIFHGSFTPQLPGQELELWSRSRDGRGNPHELTRNLARRTGYWSCTCRVETHTSYEFRVEPRKWSLCVQLYFRETEDGPAAIRWRRAGHNMRNPNDKWTE